MRWISKWWIALRQRLPRFFFPTPISYLLLDHIEPCVYMDDWSSLPFNGQTRRMRVIAAISLNLDVGAVIETGTYLGSTTPYLAGIFQCKVHTIEINAFYAERARERFQRSHQHSNIELLLGDSAHRIRDVLKDINQTTLVLAYLDAHWLDEIPTGKEIQALLDWGGEWLAIIDDFLVPSDPGYKFDSYGDIQIGMEILPKHDSIEVWVPKEPSNFESGVRSGTAYVFSNNAVREGAGTFFSTTMQRLV